MRLKMTTNEQVSLNDFLKKYIDLTPMPNMAPKVNSLCYYLAKRVCGEDVQDALVILSGPRGSGKSISALDLADGIAKYISILKYGDASHKKEFFNISNVASIDEESLLNIISKVEIENSVIILDDGSIALNSRNSMSTINKAVVNLITISRHKRNVVIITTPSRGQIDVAIRRMCSHWGHIKYSHHDEGYNDMQFRKLTFHQNSNKTTEANITAKDLGYEGKYASKIKIQTWRVPAPKDKQLIIDYEKMRSNQGDALISEANAMLKQAILAKKEKLGLIEKEETKPKRKTAPPTTLPKKVQEVTGKVEKADDLIARGYTKTSACKMVKLPVATYNSYKRGD
jgi:hypothetical protein